MGTPIGQFGTQLLDVTNLGMVAQLHKHLPGYNMGLDMEIQ